MTLAIGFLLAAWVLLITSPWLWPRRELSRPTIRAPFAPLALALT